MTPTVVVDCFPESARHYVDGYAIVAVDVIRATTTAVTGVARGRRCFPVPSIEAALPLAARLEHPLLVGELGGNMPYGFDLTNSPVEIDARADVERPMILLSSSGTQLIENARPAQAIYLGCLRNWRGLAWYLAERHTRVALLGAGTRGEFREEDQLCCAWIAAALIDRGYHPENRRTQEVVDRWRDADATACETSRSAEYLRRTAQQHDLRYIVEHVDDLQAAFKFEQGEVVMIPLDEEA